MNQWVWSEIVQKSFDLFFVDWRIESQLQKSKSNWKDWFRILGIKGRFKIVWEGVCWLVCFEGCEIGGVNDWWLIWSRKVKFVLVLISIIWERAENHELKYVRFDGLFWFQWFRYLIDLSSRFGSYENRVYSRMVTGRCQMGSRVSLFSLELGTMILE